MARITIFLFAVTTVPALAAAQGPRSSGTSSGAISSGAISSSSHAADAERVERLDGWLRHQA
jgi:hypothetical protein